MATQQIHTPIICTYCYFFLKIFSINYNSTFQVSHKVKTKKNLKFIFQIVDSNEYLFKEPNKKKNIYKS